MSNNSSSTTSFVQLGDCTIIYVSVFSIRAVLLLPVSTFILFLGLQNCKHRSVQTASHFDVLTFHLAVMEFFWAVAFPCHVAAKYLDHLVTMLVTLGVISLAFYGEILFHILTCVERYVAVLHPVTYLKMKTNRGVRIRNVSIGCVWLTCLLAISLDFGLPYKYAYISFFCILAFSLTVTSFCTISVLCVLTRQDHGETGGKKKQMDQSKHRTFCTITIISSVQWLWFVGLLISKLLIYFNFLEDICVAQFSIIIFNLPSCLVMPLLYLNRAGKPSCRCYAE